MLLVVAAMVMLGLTLHSVLDLWLLLVLWGWLLEMALIALPSTSYTAGWYAARSLGLLSGLFVLFTLLVETSKLYAQTVLQLVAQKQEREHRSMLRDAITASIAHELRQPLSAILLNAHVSRNALCPEGATLPCRRTRLLRCWTTLSLPAKGPTTSSKAPEAFSGGRIRKKNPSPTWVRC